MTRFLEPVVIEQRRFGDLCRMMLGSPDLAAYARPGQYLLVRCAEAHSADPLLRRVLFVSGVDRSAGTLTLLFAPDERGLHWLAQRAPGTSLDVVGALGTPFELDARTRNLLLVGSGDGVAALLFLAREAVSHGIAVMLLAAAPVSDRLPPPFLLPAEVEYQASDRGAESLLALLDAQTSQAIGELSPLAWADQVCATLPQVLCDPLAGVIRTGRLRWSHGFAQVLLAQSLPCGVGACLACLVQTRQGLRTCCHDGPVFDLRDLAWK